MLNPVREGEEDYIEAIRYRRRLKIFENFLVFFWSVTWRPAKVASVRPEQTSGKCSSGITT